MMVSMETYLRRGQRRMQRLLLEGKSRGVLAAGAWVAAGLLLSAASLMDGPQPLVLGALCALSGWQAAAMSLGAVVGYPLFWGMAGRQGIVWAAVGGILGIMLGDREECREQPLMKPALAAVMTAVTGLAFQVFLEDRTPPQIYLLRTASALLSALLFAQAAVCRDAITDWLVGAVGVLALSQVALGPVNLGCVAGGLLAVTGAFPGAALAGLALDLARVTPAPMTAVLCMAYFVRLAPFDRRWQQYAAPGAAYGVVMLLAGSWDLMPLPGLVLGGIAGSFLPPRPALSHRRGETGLAQVRLELGAEVMSAAGRLLLDMQPPAVDIPALMDKVRLRACEGCSARRGCTQCGHLTAELLEHPLEADCRKPGRLLPELRRAREQLKWMQAERARQGECRGALLQQYRFLGDFLRQLGSQLPRRGEKREACFRLRVSARSRGKGTANADRCLAFPGPGCRYFVLLCDGMGTGGEAAREGAAAAAMLRRLLVAGFPPEHALQTLNSLLVLRGLGGAVTVDLAEIRLDVGHAILYKWGAAPSWVLRRKGVEKIGTATAPPGLSVSESREAVQKLSLRRGEVLFLLSDGVDGEAAFAFGELTPDTPPGELAAKILERGRGRQDDDATAAAVRLLPTGPALS